jgi:hypothetical protein
MREGAVTTCTGNDEHLLGWSGETRLLLAAAAGVATLLIAFTGAFGQLGALVVGLDLGVVLACATSRHVVADHLVTSWFGRQRITALRDIDRARRYSYRGSISLQLYPRGGRRVSVPVKFLGFRLDPVAAGHLLHWLNRPDVAWEPGAWDLLAEPAGVTGEAPTRPEGAEVPPRRLGRWFKVSLGLSLAAAVAGLVALPVISGLAWRGYEESARIQKGPTALATLEREWTTSYSDRSGTHHTTHFRVRFNPLQCFASGAARGAGPYCRYATPIETTVNAHGVYDILPAGDRLHVRYDAASPTHAELPGRRMNTRTTAVAVTVITVVVIGVMVVTWLTTRRSRLRRRELHAQVLAAGGLSAPPSTPRP